MPRVAGKSVLRARSRESPILRFFLVLTLFGATLAGPLPWRAAVAAEFPAQIEVSDLLDGTKGALFYGIFSNDRVRTANAAGDVNGDGIGDLIAGAARANLGGRADAGQGYVIFGTTAHQPSIILSQLNGGNGFRINGIDAGDQAGRWVNGLGDVNGDGRDDVILGAPFASPLGRDSAGEAYIVFGSNQSFPADLEAGALDGSNGFTIIGAHAGEDLGHPVAWAGDINADGINDMLVGSVAPTDASGDRGQLYVVFGQSDGFPAVLDLRNLSAADGVLFTGVSQGDQFGFSAYGAGDFNGDNIDDFIIGAPYRDANGVPDAGVTYVIFGDPSGFSGGVDLRNLDGRRGLEIRGMDEGGVSGRSVSLTGDVNGDGLDDVVIGAPFTDIGGQRDVGKAFVVYGNVAGYGGLLNLRDLNGANGFELTGVAADDFTGRNVGCGGDVNRDGFADVFVGARGVDLPGTLNVGRGYVILGQGGRMPAEISLDSLDGDNGFSFNGVDRGDNFGRQVGCADDLNGDGVQDLFAVSAAADSFGHPNAGEVYIFFDLGQSGGGGNAPPVLNPIGDKAATEGQALVFGVTALDPGDTLALTMSSLPGSADFTDHGDGTGTFSWTPATGSAAGSPYPVTFTARDSTGQVDRETIDIEVSPADGGGGGFLQSGTGDGIVSMEGENAQARVSGSGHDWETVSLSGASGGQAVAAFPDSGLTLNSSQANVSPRLDFQVEFVRTGTHYVWVRGHARNGGSNSLYAGVNGVINPTHLIQSVFQTVAWTSGPVVVEVGSVGSHTVNLWMREDGYRVDKVVLTTNPNFVPTGSGPPESPGG